MYASKSIFILFTSANYGHIDSIDFSNIYTRTFFIELAITVFFTHTQAHEINIVL